MKANRCTQRAYSLTGGLLALVLLLLLAGTPEIAGAADTRATHENTDRPPAAGWHGREIREPWERPSRAAAQQRGYPRGWSAGEVALGSGYLQEGGSERVREVQRRLLHLGYRPGPVDGLLGPRTSASIEWFQVKHGFRPDGVVDIETLQHLRSRSRTKQNDDGRAQAPREPAERADQPEARDDRQDRRAGRDGAERDVKASGEPDAEASGERDAGAPGELRRDTDDGVLPWTLIAGAAALILALVALVVAATRRDRPQRKPIPSLVRPRPAGPQHALAQLVPGRNGSPKKPPTALGYVCGDRPSAIEARANVVEACERNDWRLLQIVRDIDGDGRRTFERPGLKYAIDRLEAGDAELLVVGRLDDLGHSVADLPPLLEWFAEADAGLVVLDVGLDTSKPEGKLATRVLLSVSQLERARGPDDRLGKRPAVADQPELLHRILAMRDSGMTLQGIADTLNSEGVPTVRGGKEWRPSSVQAALGYKRRPSEEPR